MTTTGLSRSAAVDEQNSQLRVIPKVCYKKPAQVSDTEGVDKDKKAGPPAGSRKAKLPKRSTPR